MDSLDDVDGNWIRTRRLAEGMSQTTLGVLVGKDSSWVDQVEKSIRIPSVRTRAAILEILGDPVKPNPNMGRRP